jgi:tetratricopeptide (TPR) repeat protein
MTPRDPALALAIAVLAVVPSCKGTPTAKPGEASTPVKKEPLEQEVSKARQKKLVELANDDLDVGRWVSAIGRAEEALRENPANAVAYAILGKAYWRGGDPVASTEAYREALALEADEFGAGNGLASNLRAEGNHAAALKLLDRLIAAHEDQFAPHLEKLWSYYALADADHAVDEVDALFRLLPAKHRVLPVVQAYAGYVRTFAGKGKLCEVDGTVGTIDAGIDHTVAMKFGHGVVGGRATRIVFFENVEESVVDAGLVRRLHLDVLGEVIPVGRDEPVDLVLVPEVELGGLSLRRVPAMVRDLSVYAPALGETPGVLLGRQALQAFGALTFDFPARTLTLHEAPPGAAPPGTVELPLMLLEGRTFNAAIVPVRIDGSDHEFWAMLGGPYGSSVSPTRKAYLESGHRLFELDHPEDPQRGLKIVYIDDLELGGAHIGGLGGLVLVADPPDQTTMTFLSNAQFEIGGYINTRLMSSWSITYAINSGRAYIDPTPT